MCDKDKLSFGFELEDIFDENLKNKTIVKIILRLIHNQRTWRTPKDKRQKSCCSLAFRELFGKSRGRC